MPFFDFIFIFDALFVYFAAIDPYRQKRTEKKRQIPLCFRITFRFSVEMIFCLIFANKSKTTVEFRIVYLQIIVVEKFIDKMKIGLKLNCERSRESALFIFDFDFPRNYGKHVQAEKKNESSTQRDTMGPSKSEWQITHDLSRVSSFRNCKKRRRRMDEWRWNLRALKRTARGWHTCERVNNTNGINAWLITHHISIRLKMNENL